MTNPINKRATYKFFDEIYQFFVMEKHTPREILQKIFDIRDSKGSWRYGWIARSAIVSMQQVLIDRGIKIDDK